MVDAAGIELAGGLVTIGAEPRHERAAAVGSVNFDPQSAMLTPDAVARLAQFLAEAETPATHIKVVGEAAAPALALDRALAVGLALVQSGVPADRLELTLARGGSGAPPGMTSSTSVWAIRTWRRRSRSSTS
jgi:outer membrane protein OmpA-like peptidoglycan-associated protein